MAALYLQANPGAWISVTGKTIPVTARLASGQEREELWRRWLDVQPSAETLAELAGRQVPIFILERRAGPAQPSR